VRKGLGAALRIGLGLIFTGVMRRPLPMGPTRIVALTLCALAAVRAAPLDDYKDVFCGRRGDCYAILGVPEVSAFICLSC
jgi:hypothetical protein